MHGEMLGVRKSAMGPRQRHCDLTLQSSGGPDGKRVTSLTQALEDSARALDCTLAWVSWRISQVGFCWIDTRL